MYKKKGIIKTKNIASNENNTMKTPTKYISALKEEEREELKRVMKESNSARERIRAHSILLSEREFSIDEIARIYEVDRDTVSIWLNNWEEVGFEALKDLPKSGRPPILSNKEQEQVKELLKEDPRSIKRVAAHIKKKTGKEVTEDIIRRIVKTGGGIWKRVRKSLKSKRNEEEFREFSWELDELQEKADEGLIDLRYFDIAGCSLNPVIPYAWHLERTTIAIECAKSERLNILGFMNTDNELDSFIFEGSIDSQLVIDCFNLFCETITKKTVVVLDNAPIHTSDEFEEYIEEWQKKGLYVKFLPEYSPELNKIEILWRKLKYEWLPFSAYHSISNLYDSLCDILGSVGSKYQISFS